jgi:hypothetical protein
LVAFNSSTAFSSRWVRITKLAYEPGPFSADGGRHLLREEVEDGLEDGPGLAEARLIVGSTSRRVDPDGPMEHRARISVGHGGDALTGRELEQCRAQEKEI